MFALHVHVSTWSNTHVCMDVFVDVCVCVHVCVCACAKMIFIVDCDSGIVEGRQSYKYNYIGRRTDG